MQYLPAYSAHLQRCGQAPGFVYRANIGLYHLRLAGVLLKAIIGHRAFAAGGGRFGGIVLFNGFLSGVAFLTCGKAGKRHYKAKNQAQQLGKLLVFSLLPHLPFFLKSAARLRQMQPWPKERKLPVIPGSPLFAGSHKRPTGFFPAGWQNR